MKPSVANDTPKDLTDAEVNKLLRYQMYRSVCRILDAGSTREERARLRRQRNAWEKKHGYDLPTVRRESWFEVITESKPERRNSPVSRTDS
jgi:hypothetical protein